MKFKQSEEEEEASLGFKNELYKLIIQQPKSNGWPIRKTDLEADI